MPSEREELHETYLRQFHSLFASLPVAAAGSRWETLVAMLACGLAYRELCMPGYREFLKGSVVIGDPKNFWPEGKRQAEAFEEVKRLFHSPGQGLAMALEPQPVTISQWRTIGDRFQIRRDYMILLPGRFIVDCLLVLECDAEAAASRGKPVEWRVAGMELIRAHDYPAARAGPPGPRP
jgi:hypothetical protein